MLIRTHQNYRPRISSDFYAVIYLQEPTQKGLSASCCVVQKNTLENISTNNAQILIILFLNERYNKDKSFLTKKNFPEIGQFHGKIKIMSYLSQLCIYLMKISAQIAYYKNDFSSSKKKLLRNFLWSQKIFPVHTSSFLPINTPYDHPKRHFFEKEVCHFWPLYCISHPFQDYFAKYGPISRNFFFCQK